VRKKHNIKEGTQFVLLEKDGGLVLEKEEKIRRILKYLSEKEDRGWMMLGEKSLEEVWDNEQDEKTWGKYV
jgi:bifunctional DNA-binding transcriptional regulator/antitoxin component of YhaV-PrlF toxin-antitoxin module